MTRRHRRWLAFTVVAFCMAPICLLTIWAQTRGNWTLSASNTEQGVSVRIYWRRPDRPCYVALLRNRHIPRDVQYVTVGQVPPDVGKSTFYDGTVRPGRWTLVIDGVTLDVMEQALYIDGVLHHPSPGE